MPIAYQMTGLVPATFTPMKADSSLNLAQVAPLVRRLQAQGVGGLFVCGTTGEGALLTSSERMATLEAYVAAAGTRTPVVAHVGHAGVADARELAAHAQRSGAAAISALAPSYFKPTSIETLVESMAQIAAGAPELPFYYYHIPGFTGVTLDMAEFLRQASARIPNLAGIKYTSPTLFEFQSCAAVDAGRFDLLWGVDEMLLGGLATGARGAVGSTYNLAPRLYNELIAAFAAGNLLEAQRLQLLSVRMVEVIKRYRPLPAQKAMMSFIGIDAGPTRLPLQPMSAEETAALKQELDAIGFLQWMV